VSLDLHVGEVHAVIGTNGAGKSTLINMLSGEIAASEGRIALDGADDITRRSAIAPRAPASAAATSAPPSFRSSACTRTAASTAQAALRGRGHLWQSSQRLRHSVGIGARCWKWPA
jgi:branched-chain amino acid transport system ATP-binding protein